MKGMQISLIAFGAFIFAFTVGLTTFAVTQDVHKSPPGLFTPPGGGANQHGENNNQVDDDWPPYDDICFQGCDSENCDCITDDDCGTGHTPGSFCVYLGDHQYAICNLACLQGKCQNIGFTPGTQICDNRRYCLDNCRVRVDERCTFTDDGEAVCEPYNEEGGTENCCARESIHGQYFCMDDPSQLPEDFPNRDAYISPRGAGCVLYPNNYII